MYWNKERHLRKGGKNYQRGSTQQLEMDNFQGKPMLAKMAKISFKKPDHKPCLVESAQT
jgi:hypothetical protein